MYLMRQMLRFKKGYIFSGKDSNICEPAENTGDLSGECLSTLKK